MKKKFIWLALPIILLLPVLGWLGGSIYLLYKAPTFVFLPDRSREDKAPENFQTFFITNKNNEKLDVIWKENTSTSDVILYLHGNSGWTESYLPILAEKGTVFSAHYPGFGSAEGKPSYSNIYETADLMVKYLNEKGYKNENIIVWGHSLGGAPAVYLASKHTDFKKVVVVNSFSSIKSMCEPRFHIFCTFSGLVFNSAKYAKEAKGTVRIFHSKADKTIPFSEGEALFEAFGTSDKRFTPMEGDHVQFDLNLTFE